MAGKARILTVEDDPQVQHALRAVLTQYGYEVVQAMDGMEGLRMAQAYQPDLFILDVMMPQMDGWTLLRELRSRPEFALTPAIFLTALPIQDSLVDGFKLGGVDYVPKPFRFEELVQRVGLALARRAQVEAILRARVVASIPPPPPTATLPPNTGPTSGLRGSLDQLGLASLLSMMELEKKAGRLQLTRHDGMASGTIILRDGRVIRAELMGNPPVVGPPAVYEMLSWTEGQVEFRPEAVDGPDTVNATTTFLLMEGARIVDERNKAGGL